MKNALFDFILKEWLLLASGAGFVLTSLYAGHLPSYSVREFQVLFILFVFFVAIRGVELSGIVSRLSRNIGRGGFIPFKLVAVTFFLSMFITNDIALLLIVPLTLALDVEKKGILVIMEALAANAGSALTPFGNPQNLYIYWFYNLTPGRFVASIAPFSLLFLLLLGAVSLTIRVRESKPAAASESPALRTYFIHGLLLSIVLLSVLRFLPAAVLLIVVAWALLFNRKALRVDYFLLASFLLFFGTADNLRVLLKPELANPEHTFLLSALASQVMSNVPATLLIAKFTSNWRALLWGSNAGGFGSLFGSLANMIAYKLYVTHEGTERSGSFTAGFLFGGYTAFLAAVGLYYALGVL